MRYTDNNRHQGKKNTKKGLLVLITALFILMVTVGSTLAYVLMHSETVTNTFIPAFVASQVNETFKNNTKTNVRIENVGNTEAYIRAAIVVTWKEKETGNMSAIKPVAGTDYKISLNEKDWFFNTDDSFYYHRGVVDYQGANKETSVLIYECTPIATKVPEGFELCVEIVASAIQSNPTTVVEEQWNVAVDTENDNKLSLKSGS